jgi:hypothetical protein
MTEPADQTPRSVSEDLIPAVDELVRAILDVGVAITHSVARAADPALPASQAATGSVEQIIRNGTAAIAGVVRMTTDGVRAGRAAQPTNGASAAGSSTYRPTVTAGSELRMPLLIENPAADSTGPLVFAAISTVGPGGPDGSGLPAEQVRCEPETLQISGRDFEKLTVFVRTTPQTAIGEHRVQVGVPGTVFDTTVAFDVVAP